MSHVAIGELFEYVIGGGWGSETPAEGLVPVAVIRGADFPEATLQNVDGLPRRFEIKNAALKRELIPGDIVLEISGGTRDRPTGRTIFITEGMVRSAGSTLIPASFCRLIRPKSAEVDSRWLYYILQDWWNGGGAWLYQNQSTGIANFRFKVFADALRIDVPARGRQVAIAEVLGALDGKIAANEEVISLVDRLFHLEWRKFYASDEGWSRAFLGDIAPTQYGLTASAEKGAEGPYFLRVTDINKSNWIDWGSVPAVSRENLDFSKYSLDRGDLLVARMGDPGKSAIYEGTSSAAVFASYLVRLKPPSFECGLYLYGFLKSDHFSRYADSVITGTVQRNMNAKLIGAAPLSVPPGEAIGEFARRVGPLRDRIASGLQENMRLAATRDELLPLLMSGKITVKDAEKTVEEVV